MGDDSADLIRAADVALRQYLATQATRPQRALAQTAPTLMVLIAQQCAVQPASAFAEDAAVTALCRVRIGLAANAAVERRQAVHEWFWSSERLLYPISEAVCITLKGGRTDPRIVATQIVKDLAALPPDKKGLIWHFGTRSFVSQRGDAIEKIVAFLQEPPRKHRRRWDLDGMDVSEIEALARLPPAPEEPPRRPVIVMHEVVLKWDFLKGEDP